MNVMFMHSLIFKIRGADKSYLVMVVLLLWLHPFITSVPHTLLVGGADILVYAASLFLFRAIGKADVQVLRQISKDMGAPSVIKKMIRFLDRHSR